MTEITVTFQKEDGTAEETLNDVSLSLKVSEAREAAQMRLGLPENSPYRLVLERTKEVLRDNVTFREAGIQQGDKLILVLPIPQGNKGFTEVQTETSNSANSASLVTYNLKLTIPSDSQQTATYDYSIELIEFYEDNPQRFFSDFNGRERQNFATALNNIVPREVQNSEIDKILRDWGDDISLGYRTTVVKI